MSKLRLFCGLLAAALAGSAVAAAPPTTQKGFYVVVPLGPARAAAAAEGIDVNLTGQSLPYGLVGIPYDGVDFRKLLTVTGDSTYTGYGVKWSVVSGNLPAGLTLNADGTLSGTPTANGTAEFSLRASYKTKTGEQAYEIVVGRIVIGVASGTPPQAIVGQAYSYDLKPLLTVTGDPAYAGAGAGVSWSIVSNSLPAGITLRTDGTISGTPTAGGTGTIVARATYRNAAGEQAFEVVSLAIKVGLAASTPPQAIVGQNYNFDLKALLSVTGDSAYSGSGVTWTALSDNLPAGISLRADGTIAGMPTAAGTGFITVRASYRGENDEQAYEVVTLAINVVLGAATPPQAIVGQSYVYDLKNSLTVTGDNAYNGSGVTWTVVSNTLPAGLTLRANGTIAGTPTAAGAGAVTARATYRNVSGQQVYQVVTLDINITLAAATPPQGIVGQAFLYDLKPLLTVTGDNAYNGSGVTWSVVSATLPEGLSLRANGTIAGTPTVAGTGTVTARATYRGNNGQQTYQVVTLAVKVVLGAGTPPQAIVGQAYSYNLKPLLNVTGDTAYTGAGVTWSTISSTLPDGLALAADGTISGTPTTSGTGSLTARATYRGVNGDQTYQVVTLSINVALGAGTPPQAIVGQAYSYDLKPLLSVSGDSAYNGSGVTWTVVSSTLSTGLQLFNNGTISGTPTASGTGTITARATYRNVNGQQSYQIVTLGITVALAAAAPPQAIVGQAYSYSLKQHLSVSGDPAYSGAGVTWTAMSSTLPAGLQLAADGTISGTPTASGTGSITARATYRGVNGDRTYQVVSLNITVSLAAGSAPQGIVGQAYAYDIKPLLSVSGDSGYTGSGVTWSAVSSTLPAGLSLQANGTITGTPTAAGSGSVTVRASYRGNNGQQTYQVVTINIVISLAAGTPPQGIAGQAYSYDLKPLLNVSGDPAYSGAGVTWSVVSGSLPAGLSLQANGTITGTPTAAGTGTITARAAYRGNSGQQAYQVVTLAITVSLSAATPPQAIVGQAYSYDLKPRLSVSGDGAYNGSGVTWAAVAGSLPAGLALQSNGVISGTPTAGGTGTITARATYRGVNGQQAYQVVSLAINVSLSAATPPSARVGVSYSFDVKPYLTVSGDSGYTGAGVTWGTVSTSLPSGLSLTTAGVISGTPTAATSGTLTARATYRNVSGQQAYSITAAPAYTYAWNPAGWSTPAACGATTSTRSVTCLRSDGATVADASCTAAKPATTQPATDYSTCSYAWTSGGWNTPAACGPVTQTRSVSCLRSDGTTVADASCTAAKPATTQASTNYSTCSYAWTSGAWNTPAACGPVTQTRSVSCLRSDGTTVADASCTAAKPATTQASTNYSTCSYAWSTGGWNTPAACGPVTQTRSVSCVRSDGTTVADGSCAAAKPATTQASTDYSTCTSSFSYGAWGACSKSCGGGTQTRPASCVRSDGTTVADSSCGTPVTSQSCNTQACAPRPPATGCRPTVVGGRQVLCP